MVEVDRENFEAEVLASPEPVLVDFWGPACQPCLALMPAVEELEKRYAGRLRVVKVNAARNRRLCLEHRVLSLPTFLVFSRGREVGRLSGGEVSAADLERFVARMVGGATGGEGCACS